MKTAIVTGSAGLIGSEAVSRLTSTGWRVVGIDNDMRRTFFGDDASTAAIRDHLVATHANYQHEGIDIRDTGAVNRIFREHANNLRFVIHAAAQPSHDWAASDPSTDFTVNANGTIALLEATRNYAKDTPFAFLSTNKVYGDRPNSLPLIEQGARFEIEPGHQFENGIDESMSIDDSTHSLFGVSKAAADLLVQEYGRYFGMPTACFRGGCLTGPAHAGTRLHGFLSYLMKCTMSGQPYTIYGYKGKQVRDNIHSHDLVSALLAFQEQPRAGLAYNIGGGRTNNCSMQEAVAMCEELTGRRLQHAYSKDNRIGDHIWWISNTARFESHYPEWRQEYTLVQTLTEIRDALT